MAWTSALTEMFELEVPLIQAPMGGGPTTTALVAAVCEAGALGSVAAGYLSAEALDAELSAARAATSRPFAVNVFASAPARPTAEQLAAVGAVLDPLRAELGLPPVSEVSLELPDLAEQADVILASPPAMVSFTFGLLPKPMGDAFRAAGCALMGTATSVSEAIALTDAGADLVCAQGAEAGAHRGTFLEDEAAALVGTLALVPQVCDAVTVPVVAAGGVMDGRGLVATLALGAAGAQLGTAFLRCPEAGTADPWRQALAAAGDTATGLSAAVTGRTARGIRNRLMTLLAAVDPLPPYPVLHALTADLRRVAASRGDAELMSLWCGQGAPLGTELPAAEVVAGIARGAHAVMAGLDGQRSGSRPGAARRVPAGEAATSSL